MLTRAEQKLLNGLKRRKIRDSEGACLVEGVRVVEDLLESEIALRFAVVSSSLEDTPRGARLAAALEERCPVHRVSEAELSRYAATEAVQGVVVVAEVPRFELASMEARGARPVLVLDAVQDPGNFGTLARSAEAFGALYVAVLPGTVDPWNPKSIRAAAGATFRVPVVPTGLPELVEWLHENGYAFYGADAAGTPVDRIERPSRVALAVGNEGAGLGHGVREAVDARVAVPHRGRAESLNVAVAAGILLYLFSRSD